MAIEPFPFKREFIPDPVAIWNKILSSPQPKIKYIDRVTFPQPTKKYHYRYGKHPAVIITQSDEYSCNILSDFFTESVRLQANVVDYPSPLDYYSVNYSTIVEKAEQLRPVNSDQPLRYWVREAVYSLTKECTNFKIMVVKFLIEFFQVRVILDPSAGWGDRILGAAAAGALVYHGIDPNPALVEPYKDMIQFVSEQDPQNKLGPISPRFSLTCQDFLQVNLTPESYDCVLTSPPFYNYEIYSSAPGQSIQNRPTLDSWFTQFLVPYLTKAWMALVSGGYMILYISDVKTGQYTERMADYIRDNFKSEFLGILAICKENLKYGHPLWVWKKK